jgi:hypothetical protein
MTFLQKFFGSTRSSDVKSDALHCRHESLSPMWENIEDMGEVDKVSRYRCLGCGVFLSTASAPQDAHRGQARTGAPNGVTHAAA